MSQPTPGTRSTGKLVWAPDDVLARIGQQVTPQVSLPRSMASTAMLAVVFTWPPAFLVLAAMTLVVPSTTDGAGVGTAAFWALQIALLIAITAMLTTLVTALRKRSAEPATPAAAGADTPTRATPLRVAGQVLLTGASAWLVLALHGLSVGRVAVLTVVLLVVLHLLPMVAARLLLRLRGRRQATESDPLP